MSRRRLPLTVGLAVTAALTLGCNMPASTPLALVVAPAFGLVAMAMAWLLCASDGAR